jgi:hypothetical protein
VVPGEWRYGSHTFVAFCPLHFGVLFDPWGTRRYRTDACARIYLKPFNKGQKNDYNDAEAIADATLPEFADGVREGSGPA